MAGGTVGNGGAISPNLLQYVENDDALDRRHFCKLISPTDFLSFYPFPFPESAAYKSRIMVFFTRFKIAPHRFHSRTAASAGAEVLSIPARQFLIV